MPSELLLQRALVPLAWSRIFSPLVSDSLRREAWKQLEVPGNFEAQQSVFWNTFHVGLPHAPVPLTIHTILGVDGGAVREDILRAMDHVGLAWGDNRLPPDHLACVLELLAVAVEREEPVLHEGILSRYVIPWCDSAAEAANRSAPPMGEIVSRLRNDLEP